MYNNIGGLIRQEREAAGLSQKQLAKMAGYRSYQTLLKIEKGERNITISDLSQIAGALNLNINYFLDYKGEDECHVLWRNAADKKECKIYENKLRTYTTNYFHLNEMMKVNVAKYRPYSIREFKSRYSNYLSLSRFILVSKMAEDFIRDLNLGDYPAVSLLRAISEKGIIVFYAKMHRTGSAACYVCDEGAAILLNNEDAPWRRYFDIGHELYHILTWELTDFKMHNYSLKESDTEEKFADAFAANLLVPKTSLYREIDQLSSPDELDPITVSNIAVKFRVSVDVMLNRLEFMKIIDEKKKKQLMRAETKANFWQEYLSKCNDDYASAGDDEYTLPYLMAVYSAWQKEKISKMKMAEYLNKNIGEIDYYLNQKGLIYE